jgi:hypothetical protein
VCHWLFTVTLTVLIGNGLEVFATFPTFGANSSACGIFSPPSLARLGEWLGGALHGTQ